MNKLIVINFKNTTDNEPVWLVFVYDLIYSNKKE